LIHRLIELREERPACAWVVSPWTDLTMSGATLVTKDAVDPIIHKAYLDELADAYLSVGMDRTDARVSPLYADLKGFPPILVQVGAAETLWTTPSVSRLQRARSTYRSLCRSGLT